MEWYPLDDIILEMNKQNAHKSKYSIKVSGWVVDGWWKYAKIPFNECTTYHVRYDLEIHSTEKNDISFEISDRLQHMTKLYDKLAVTAVPADERPLSTSYIRGKAYTYG